jgi:hypothetical protein
MRAVRSLGIVLVTTTLLPACDSPSGPGMSRISQSPVLIVVPGSATLEGGTSMKFTATVTDENGETTFPVDVSWVSSNQAVASVHHDGSVQGLNSGQAQIFATWKTARGSARVTVVGGRAPKPDGGPCQLPAVADADLVFPTGGKTC